VRRGDRARRVEIGVDEQRVPTIEGDGCEVALRVHENSPVRDRPQRATELVSGDGVFYNAESG
jgi:hypothetical protein